MSDRVFRDRKEAGRVLAGLLDHYRDEARHQVYFAGLFPCIWRALEGDRRDRLGRLLAPFMAVFLENDTGPLRRALAAHGFDEREIRLVLAHEGHESGPMAQRRALRATLRLLGEEGVFAVPAVTDALAAAGLPTSA